MQEFMLTTSEIQNLIARAQAGEREAFDQLFSEFGNRLETWIRRHIGVRLRFRVDAEDIRQETHLRAFELIGRFSWRHEDSFFQWLSTIARHLIWNVSQKRPRDELRLTIDPPKSGTSPSKAMRRQERFRRLEQSLADLRPQERNVVRLALIEGLRAREIAEQLSCPEPTVRSLLARALRKLKDSMGDTRSLNLPDQKFNFGEPDNE